MCLLTVWTGHEHGTRARPRVSYLGADQDPSQSVLRGGHRALQEVTDVLCISEMHLIEQVFAKTCLVQYMTRVWHGCQE